MAVSALRSPVHSGRDSGFEFTVVVESGVVIRRDAISYIGCQRPLLYKTVVDAATGVPKLYPAGTGNPYIALATSIRSRLAIRL